MHRAPEYVLKVLGIAEAFYRRGSNLVNNEEGVVKRLDDILLEIPGLVEQLIDPEGRWRFFLKNWLANENGSIDRSWLLPELDVARVTTEKIKRSDFIRELVRHSQRIILHLHRDNATSPPSFQSYKIHTSYLHMLGSFIWGRQLDNYLMKELSVLDVLTALVGWPPWMRLGCKGSESEEMDIVIKSGWESQELFRWESFSQVLAWKIILAMDIVVPEMQDHYLRTVTCANITELWLWTLWKTIFHRSTNDVFQESQQVLRENTVFGNYGYKMINALHIDDISTDIDVVDELPPIGPNRNEMSDLEELLSMAFTVCVTAYTITIQEIDASEAAASPKQLPTPPKLWEEMFSSLFQVFQKPTGGSRDVADSRGNRVREMLRDGKLGILIQRTALKFLRSLVRGPIDNEANSQMNGTEVRRMWCFGLCMEQQIWNLLYSDTFFMWPHQHSTELALMRKGILNFTVFTAIRVLDGNQTQCAKLLAMLYVFRSIDAKVVISTLEALRDVLVASREITQESLKRLNCVGELTSILRECANNAGTSSLALKSEGDDSDQFVRRKIFWILLDVFDELMLDNRELANIARRDEDTLAVMFGLLFHENSRVADFAIKHLSNMTLVLCSEPSQDGVVVRRGSESSDSTISSRSNILRQYMEAFPHQVTSLALLNVQKRLLSGLKYIAICHGFSTRERKFVQQAIVHANSLSILLDMLQKPVQIPEMSVENQREVNKEKLIAVMQCIAAIVSGSKASRKLMLSGSCSYPALASALKKTEMHDVAISEVFGLINEPTERKEGDDDDDGIAIRNGYAIDILVDLFEVVDIDLKEVALERLILMAERSDLNKWYLAQSNVVSQMIESTKTQNENLERILDPVKKIIEIITVFSVKVSVAKSMLNTVCLQVKTEGNLNASLELPANHATILQTMYQIAQTDVSMDYFYLTASDSGILLPSMERLPAVGYSFFTWIYADTLGYYNTSEDFNLVSSDSDYRPRLFSFLTKTNSGIEAFFEQGFLKIAVWDSGSLLDMKATRFRFGERKWYFVAIIHRPAQKGWGFRSPEVMIVVDGKVCVKSELHYPMENDPFQRCAIGARCLISTNTTFFQQTESDASGYLDNGFVGKFASIYFVEDAISSRQVNAIFHLGKSHCSQLRPENAELFPKQCSFLFDGALSSKLMLQIHVKATTSDDRCINLAPKYAYHSSNLTPILVSVEKCSPWSLQRAIHALGGVEVLFPLMFLFDYMSVESYRAPFVDQDDFFLQKSPAQAFFFLLTAMLKNCPQNQSNIVQAKGIRVISYLLQVIHPKHFTISAYQSINSLHLSVSENDELMQSILQSLLFEFRLWIYADLQTQLYCLNFLKNFCESRREMARTEFGIRYFLDAMQTFYWYKEDEFSVPGVHTETNCSRPSEKNELSCMRQILFDITIGFLRKRITKDDIVVLYKHLINSADYEHVCEVLNHILEHLRANRDTMFVEYSALCGGYESLCSLLRVPDAAVKARVIDLTIYFLASSRTPDKMKRKLRFEGPDAYKFVDALSNVGMTVELYRAALQYVLEFEYDAGEENRYGLKEDMPLPVIKNIRAALGIIEVLSCSDTEDYLKCLIMEELLLMLKQSQELVFTLTRILCWQQIIIKIIPANPRQDHVSYEKLKELAVEMLSFITFNHLLCEKNGIQNLEDTTAHIWIVGREDTVDIVHRLFTSVIKLVEQELHDSHGVASLLFMVCSI